MRETKYKASDYYDYVMMDLQEMEKGDLVELSWIRMCDWVLGIDLLQESKIDTPSGILIININEIEDGLYEVVEAHYIDEEDNDNDREYDAFKEHQRGII